MHILFSASVEGVVLLCVYMHTPFSASVEGVVLLCVYMHTPFSASGSFYQLRVLIPLASPVHGEIGQLLRVSRDWAPANSAHCSQHDYGADMLSYFWHPGTILIV